jgi:peptidoglycan hydrolase-like protein with peptidoglycan-binding domain
VVVGALIRKGFVPGVTDPDSGWVNGTYQELTREAVLRFQRSVGYHQTCNLLIIGAAQVDGEVGRSAVGSNSNPCSASRPTVGR